MRVFAGASGGGFCLSRLAFLLLIGGTTARAQEPQRIVMGLKFQGNKNIPSTVLSTGIATTNSGWFARAIPFRWLGFLGEKRFFNEREFVADVLRIQAIYKYSGFPEVKVDTTVQRTSETVKVKFIITEGPPIVVTRMAVTGIDSVQNESTIAGNLPLRRGQPFNRYLMAASGDSIVRRLRNRGYPAALVFRNFDQNAETREAQVTLEVVPGPLSRIRSVRVEGESPIDTSFVRRMVPARPGRLFSQDELFISQRNLYRTELFQFASVQIDSTAFPPGDSTVPLVARIRPGRGHRARGSLGYGTTDCFRGSAGWRARNWSGGGRILDLSGRLSKVGVAAPFDASLQNSICGLLSEDSVGSDKLNYNVTAAVEQPGLFGALNTGTLSIFADRRSEFKTYLREEIGGSFTFRREGLKRIPLTLSYKLSYGGTEASPANFCAFFSACTAEDVDLLQQKRFLGTLTGSIQWPRVNNVLDPSKGYFHTLEGTVSSRLLGSATTQEFVKLIANGAWYRELDRDIVLSWRLRLGTIFAPQVEFTQAQPVNFIPPEERFYGGGPNDVRGFQRNELGPLVYVVETNETNVDSILQRVDRGELDVRFSATGGNTLAVANVELRIPSPILTNRMRIAFFIDGGTVWERGREDVAPASLKVTPGFGFRIGTPLGPARLDIAYNGYERQPGALYRSSLLSGDLVKIADDFTSGKRSNLTFQFAIGQPF